ncbi:MAG: tyrosine-type recombinase/integrase [Candidatus Gottesmanbacteria bacterium]|nr:tyrosine-type recombinase/integrase [Candidatus Gottesmanbacteria bacterium]
MSRLGIFNQWLERTDLMLDKECIEKFFTELKNKGLKNNSLNTYRFLFRHLVSYCKDRGLASGFFDGFKSFKKLKPDIIIFTSEEIEKILNTILTYGNFRGRDTNFLDFRYRTLTMFLAYTGCRYSEAAELTVEHLDISAGKAHFVNTKTNENRTVYFTEPLKSNLRILIENRKPDDRVFRNSQDKQIQVTDYSQDLKRRARVAGITKRTFPHNFRHSYITHMLEAGVPITEVAMLVGHKDIQTTYSTYMHLADKTLERASMRHPMVRRSVDPKIIMQNIKQSLTDLKLENDPRFRYEVSDSGNQLIFVIGLNKVI